MNDSSAERTRLPASRGHQLLTLVGFSVSVFGFVFVYLMADKFWFSLDIRWLGIPVMLVAATVGHFLLKLLQSDAACALLFPIWRGKPPVFYTRFVDLDADGFTCGIRHVRWQAVDELFLTFFGNLEIRSDAFSGTVFKFPFGIALPEQQRIFFDEAKKRNAAIRSNERLEKRINSPIVKGQNMVQFAGACFLAAALLDLGFSAFYYTEMLKHYYLAESTGNDGELALADNMFKDRVHTPLTERLFEMKSAGAGIHGVRARALAKMGKLEDAIAEAKIAQKEATKQTPDDFRYYLLEARLQAQLGRDKEEKAAIDEAIKLRENFFVPRIYQIAASAKQGDEAERSTYDSIMKEFDESTFNDEPRWPPGGNSYLSERFYSDDIRYLFDRLLHVTKPKS